MSSIPWYVARSAGLMSWALLTASVLWGLTMTTKFLGHGRRPRPAWLLDLHRYLGGLAVVFVIVHIGGVLMDTFVPFQWLNVVVPFSAHWRPVAIAWGVVGLYLLAAVEITSLLRSRLPRRVWRATHFASFPLFLVATIHGLTAGTDTGTWVFEAVAALAITAVTALTGLRIARDTRKGGRSGPAGLAERPGPVQPRRPAVARIPVSTAR
jgi:predicted ferric reductase